MNLRNCEIIRSPSEHTHLHTLVYFFSLITILMVPFRNWIHVGGLGSIGRIVGLLFVVLWVFYFVSTAISFEMHPFLIGVYVLMIYYIINTTWSISQVDSITWSVRFLSITILITALWEILDSRKKRKYALQMLIIGGYIALLGLLFRYAQESTFRTSAHRYNIPGLRPNRSGGIFATLLPVSALLVTQYDWKSKPVNILNYLFIPLGTIGVLLSSSRTAFIALLPTFILIIYRFNERYDILHLLGYGIISFGIVFIAGSMFGIFSQRRLSYLRSVSNEILSGDFGGRATIWEASFTVFPNAFFLGHGSTAHRYAVEPLLSQEYSAHNTFIAVLVELGMIGFLLFMIILIYLIKLALRTNGKAEWLTILSVWIALSIAFTWHGATIWWILFTLLARSSGNAE